MILFCEKKNTVGILQKKLGTTELDKVGLVGAFGIRCKLGEKCKKVVSHCTATQGIYRNKKLEHLNRN